MSDHFEEANRYVGTTASNYDEKRKKKKGWKISEDIIFRLLEEIAAKRKGLTVLDVPVGTGRFFDVYKKLSLNVIGIDISEDMLKLAQKKSNDVDLRKGSILNLPSDIKVNIVICYGFLHLVTIEDVKKVIHSISQVNADHVIISATVKTRKKRAIRRKGMQKKTLEKIIKTQLSDKIKKKKADFAVNTSVDKNQCFNEFFKIIELIKSK